MFTYLCLFVFALRQSVYLMCELVCVRAHYVRACVPAGGGRGSEPILIHTYIHTYKHTYMHTRTHAQLVSEHWRSAVVRLLPAQRALRGLHVRNLHWTWPVRRDGYGRADRRARLSKHLAMNGSRYLLVEWMG